jgi:hypothetical protein
MIRVKCEQGTDEWRAIKAGVASPSNFDRLVTASMKPSSQADDYLYELMGEWVVGMCKELPPNLYWVNRGTEMEPQARAQYEFATGTEVTETGFVYKNRKKLIGCSPDGLPSETKGLEIKCPEPINHISYLLQGVVPKKYLPQVQGSMWITGLKQWDFMSYHPDYDPLIITVEAHPMWQRALDLILTPFAQRIEDMRESPRVVAMRDRRIQEQKKNED